MSMHHRLDGERKDLTGEHRFGDTGQLIFALVFVAVWIVDTFVLRLTTFLNPLIPGWLRTSLGCLLLVSAGLISLSSLRTVFLNVRDPPVVIRTGLFAHVRHPMYFGEVLLYAGFLCLSISIAAIVVWVGAILFLLGLCRYEEGLLVERFGEDYRRYMREVPLWIPRLRRR